MSQTLDIYEALKSGRKLTPLEAWRDFGTLRLGARIFELRREGVPINMERVTVRTRTGKASVARYSL